MSEEPNAAEGQANPAKQHKAVLVQAEGVQCMAYQDCRGKWRRFYDLELLPGEIEVVTFNN